MRALVGLLRAQIRLLEQALGEESDIHPSGFEQLCSLRLTSERLAEAVERAASARKQERSADEFPPIAGGEQSVWSLGGSGHPAKQVVQLQLVQPHIAALVENGALAPWHATDLASLQHAAQLMFDRWTGLYTRSTRNSVSRSALSERRCSRDRRGASPLSGYLLSLIADTPLDRRTGSDRRLEAAAATTPAQSCGRLSPATACASHSRRVGNVIRFALAKAPRGAIGEAPVAKASPSPLPSASVVAIECARRRSDAGASSEDVGTAERKRGPDTREGGETRSEGGFSVDGDGEQDVPRRPDLLQETNGRDPNSPHAGDEQDQR